jgi:TfoX/Sxy family transcriptional regulator of competence genes
VEAESQRNLENGEVESGARSRKSPDLIVYPYWRFPRLCNDDPKRMRLIERRPIRVHSELIAGCELQSDSLPLNGDYVQWS